MSISKSNDRGILSARALNSKPAMLQDKCSFFSTKCTAQHLTLLTSLEAQLAALKHR